MKIAARRLALAFDWAVGPTYLPRVWLPVREGLLAAAASVVHGDARAFRLMRLCIMAVM